MRDRRQSGRLDNRRSRHSLFREHILLREQRALEREALRVSVDSELGEIPVPNLAERSHHALARSRNRFEHAHDVLLSEQKPDVAPGQLVCLRCSVELDWTARPMPGYGGAKVHVGTGRSNPA